MFFSFLIMSKRTCLWSSFQLDFGCEQTSEVHCRVPLSSVDPRSLDSFLRSLSSSFIMEMVSDRK